MSLPHFSLRLKLTAWFMCIYAIVFMLLIVAAWSLQRHVTRRQLDENLVYHAAGAARLFQKAGEPRLDDGLLPLQPTNRAFVVLAVRDASGGVLASRWLVDRSALPPLRDGNSMIDANYHSLTSEMSRRLLGREIPSRMVTYRFMTPDGSARYIDLASTTDMASAESSYLHDVFLIGALGAMLATALAAWFIAGRAVEPMKKLTDAAELINPEHFGARLDVPSRDVEVERLRSALNEALTRLEEGYNAQQRFMTNVAHDLKTPLAVMLTESQVLRPGSASLREFEDYRKSMIVEMQRLGGLVEGFLTLARFDQGTEPPRVVDVPIVDTLMDAVSECDPEAQELEVHLVASISKIESDREVPQLRGDPDLLRTMLVNLIRNAIRHSPTGEAVDICVSRTNDVAEISVRDRGPGIPDEHLEVAFDHFVQVSSQEPQPTGTRIGLAIARSVAEMHDGMISIRNCIDRGCILAVSLPLDAHQGDPAANDPA